MSKILVFNVISKTNCQHENINVFDLKCIWSSTYDLYSIYDRLQNLAEKLEKLYKIFADRKLVFIIFSFFFNTNFRDRFTKIDRDRLRSVISITTFTSRL